MSCIIIFLDLVKAFDYAIRQLLFGFDEPATEAEKTATLVQLNLPTDVAAHIVSWLETNKSIFEQVGVDSKVGQLVCELYSGSWARIAADQKCLVSTTGGKQGCRLGAMIFNLIYAVALHSIRAQLAQLGLVLNIVCKRDVPFDGTGQPNETVLSDNHLHTDHDQALKHGGTKSVIDVTFVDDEALAVIAKSASALMKAVPLILSAVVKTMYNFGFKLNFSKGKSEAILKLTGKRASEFKKKIADKGGCVAFATAMLPHTSGADHLRIVNEYKHLGRFTSFDPQYNADVNHRTSSAMAAFAPIATLVFGSTRIQTDVKMRLLSSLVLSRLLYNAHIWSRLTQHAITKMNAVLMRVLRRIADQVRFQRTENTDLEIRTRLECGSIESLIRQRRLAYFTRLCCKKPATIWLLLGCAAKELPDNSPLPWIRLILDDLAAVWAHFGRRFDELGPPTTNFAKWCNFIAEWPTAFKECVESMPSFASAADRSLKTSRRIGPGRNFECHLCVCEPFINNKALLAHMRQKHGLRIQVKSYVGSDAKCPVCAVAFSTRLRCIAHLSEKRCRGRVRETCHQRLLQGNYQRLNVDHAAQLDDLDRTARREAARIGRSTPLATFATTRSRVRARPDEVGAKPIKRRRLTYKQAAASYS